MERIIELKEVIRWSPIFRAAGLNENTMRSAMHHRRELRPEEAEAIAEALEEKGIYVSPTQKQFQFSEETED